MGEKRMSTETQGYRSRSQQDAAKVYDRVTAIRDEIECAIARDVKCDTEEKREKKRKAERKKYGGMCHKLPVLIRTAGLVQALTFLQAKPKEQMWRQLGNDLAQTLGRTNLDALAGEARDASLSKYMVLTRRALEQLLWYKRYAQVLLDVDTAEAVENGGAS